MRAIHYENGKLEVKVFESTYPRKASEYAVWVVDGERKMFCAHPLTDPDTADVVAEAIRLYLERHGERRILELA